MGVLLAACDSIKERIEECRSTFPQMNYTTDMRDLMDDPAIKGVLVSSPASTHYSIAKKFLEAGKNVFVEKPLALTTKEGKELVELAGTNKRILMVGHILQYHPAVVRLKGLISSGQLGKLQYIYSNRLNIGKLRTEENILWSFAPHDISVMLSLVGAEPVEVRAFGGAYLNHGVNDTTVTTLQFPNEVKGHIFVSWLHPYKEQKLIVVGSDAMAVFDDVSEEKLFLYPHKIEWKNGSVPVALKAAYTIVPVDKVEPLRAELEHFINCVEERRQPMTDGVEGLRVLKVLEKAEESITRDSPPITRTPGMTNPKALGYFVHDTARVDNNVEIGEGTKIWHFSHVQSGSKIGRKCVLGQNVNVGNNVTIGHFCKIQNNVSIYEGVTLEDYVFCGPSMVFTNIKDPRCNYPQVGSEFYIKTLVKEGASLGANSTIVCGHTVGRFAFVGAGAVVTKDVPDFALVVGNPARIVGWVSEGGKKLVFDKNGIAHCEKSGKNYRLENGAVKEITI